METQSLMRKFTQPSKGKRRPRARSAKQSKVRQLNASNSRKRTMDRSQSAFSVTTKPTAASSNFLNASELALATPEERAEYRRLLGIRRNVLNQVRKMSDADLWELVVRAGC